jgi:hypothetical protein
LPPDLRAQAEQAIDKGVGAKRDRFDQQMKSAQAAIRKASNDEHALRDLAASAQSAEEAALADWSNAFRRRIADDYRKNPDLERVAIEAYANTAGVVLAQDGGLIKYTPPEQQAAWTAAVARCLSPEQLATWQADVAAQEKERHDIDNFLDAQADHLRETFEASIKVAIQELTTALDLPPERAALLRAIGARAVEQALSGARAADAQTLRAMEDDYRQRVLTTGRAFFGTRGNDAPTLQAIWKVGLERVLTAADRQRLATRRSERESRRAEVLGRMLLVILDEKVALTSTQRDRLLPLAMVAVQTQKTMFPAGESSGYMPFSRELFLEAASHLPEEAVRAILEPEQWLHYQQACKETETVPALDNPTVQRGGKRLGEEGADPRKAALAENAEPEEIERVLSDLLDAKTKEERERELAVVMLKTDDVARAAGLGATAIDRLRTAGRGTVEQELATWKSNLAVNVRAQLGDADAESLRNLLNNLPNMQFASNSYGMRRGHPTLWDKTVEDELTPPQLAAWKRELAARAGYKEQSTAGFVLAEFDRHYRVPEEQWDKLRPLLESVMHEYGADIDQMFGYTPANMPWYFQGYTMFLPLMGIPADRLQTLLGADAWHRFTVGAEYTNCVNYWQSVEQIHTRRMKGESE